MTKILTRICSTERWKKKTKIKCINEEMHNALLNLLAKAHKASLLGYTLDDYAFFRSPNVLVQLGIFY